MSRTSGVDMGDLSPPDSLGSHTKQHLSNLELQNARMESMMERMENALTTLISGRENPLQARMSVSGRRRSLESVHGILPNTPPSSRQEEPSYSAETRAGLTGPDPNQV